LKNDPKSYLHEQGFNRKNQLHKKPVIEPGQFKVILKRWIVERTFAWLDHFRRLAKDFEILVNTAGNIIRIVMLKLIVSKHL